MAEYIEREVAISSLDELEKTSYHNSVLWPDHVEECREALRSIPADDVRPVVLCRDCVHYKAEQKGKPWKTNRRYCCRSACVATDPDDFCSRGEKREES